MRPNIKNTRPHSLVISRVGNCQVRSNSEKLHVSDCVSDKEVPVTSCSGWCESGVTILPYPPYFEVSDSHLSILRS